MSSTQKQTKQKNQWFFEKSVLERQTIKTGIKIKKKVYSGKSPYQKIEIMDTFAFGRILILDGIIQLSKKDEFIYHEMLAHPAIFIHPEPKKILIVGGGDGGILKETLKHPIKEIYLVEIDKKIIEISQKYLPFVSKRAFKDKRAKILIEDGIKFVKRYKDFFDIAILDSTDPLGPSLKLFSKNFYQDIFNALTKKGILSIQSGCLFEQFFHLKSIYQEVKNIFPYVEIHKASIPSLQHDEYSFILASKLNLKKISSNDIKKRYNKLKLDLKYYSPEIHFTSTVLPKYLKEKINVNT